MIKNIVLAATCAALLPLWACDHKPHGPGEEAHQGEAAHTHEAPAGGTLRLNGTERWQADAPTRTGMASLRRKVDEAARRPPATAEERAALAKQLRLDIQGVLRNCTMTGPGHTELHKLIALLDADLREMESSEPQRAARALGKLQANAALFARYFR